LFPVLVILMAVTTPFTTVAVPVAPEPVPLGSTNVTEGAEVYPAPPDVIATEVITPPVVVTSALAAGEAMYTRGAFE
jgi:hypothetical protein